MSHQFRIYAPAVLLVIIAFVVAFQFIKPAPPDRVVMATGCIERPLIFDHNERPGVMQVGCAHRLARTYGLVPGTEAVFSVGHDLGLEAAVDLADHVLVRGPVIKTRTGALAVSARKYAHLGKALLPPPAKWHGLKDV